MMNSFPVLDATRRYSKDLEYNAALLKVVHDEEPKGVSTGVNIQVSYIMWVFPYVSCFLHTYSRAT